MALTDGGPESEIKVILPLGWFRASSALKLYKIKEQDKIYKNFLKWRCVLGKTFF